MNKPLVSIIIPTYNRCHLLGQTLESIISQSYKCWECIVVNDLSFDYTNELMEFYVNKDSRIKYFQRPDEYPKGGNSCRNFGFGISEGKYINWFDDDDLMIYNKLELQIHHLMNSNYPFIVCQSLVFEGAANNILGYRKKKIHSVDFLNDFIINEIKWLTQAPLIKREFLIENNIDFDESLFQSQERDYFVKILVRTSNYLFDNKPLVLLRRHKNSISYSDYDSRKKKSGFIVNFNILKNHGFLLHSNTNKYLLKSLKSSMRESLYKKDLSLLFMMLNKFIFSSFIKFSDKTKIVVGVLTLLSFKKGERFFS